MVIAAFVLAIIGLVIANRRPTKKRESVFALVVSSIFIIAIAARLIVASMAPVIDVRALEAQVGTTMAAHYGEGVSVHCPLQPPTAEGATFTCAAAGDSGSTWVVQVTIKPDNLVTWEVME